MGTVNTLAGSAAIVIAGVLISDLRVGTLSLWLTNPETVFYGCNAKKYINIFKKMKHLFLRPHNKVNISKVKQQSVSATPCHFNCWQN